MDDPLEIDNEKLREIVKDSPKEADELRNLYREGLEQTTSSLAEINQIFSTIDQKTSLILTISGIFTFLIPLTVEGAQEGLGLVYLKHFLVWCFPLQILALICFYFASKRPASYTEEFGVFAYGSADELVALKYRCKATVERWKRHGEMFEKVKGWQWFTLMFTYLYLISLLGNTYLLVFIGKPPNDLHMLLLVVSYFLMGSAMFLDHSLASRTSRYEHKLSD